MGAIRFVFQVIPTLILSLINIDISFDPGILLLLFKDCGLPCETLGKKLLDHNPRWSFGNSVDRGCGVPLDSRLGSQKRAQGEILTTEQEGMRFLKKKMQQEADVEG